MPEIRVKLTDQERLDAPDARALQELVYQYVREGLGDLIAGGSGVLSAAVWAFSDDGVTLLGSPGPFVLVTRERDLTRSQASSPALDVAHAWKSVIFSFDPAAAGHINFPVDLTAARAAGLSSGWTTRPIVWARPFEIDADSDTRRVWDVGTQLEVPTPVNTRTNLRLEFSVANTEPAAGVGAAWAPVAYCSAWIDAGSGLYQPVFRPTSAWDSPDLNTWTGESGDVYNPATNPLSVGWLTERITSDADALDAFNGISSGYAPGEDRGGSLLTVLHFLRRGLQRVLSGGADDSPLGDDYTWLGVPSLSLEGLRINLAALTSRVSSTEEYTTANTNQIANMSNASTVIASGVFLYDDGTAFSGVAEGWYLVSGFGFTGTTVMTGANWSEFTAEFERQTSLGDDLRYFFISGVFTQMDDPSAISAAGGSECTSLQLVSPLRPTLYAAVSPSAYSPGQLITYYKGSGVGLSSAQYGIPLKLFGSKVSAPQLALIDPSTLTAGGTAPRPAFHVEVRATKYLPGQEVL